MEKRSKEAAPELPATETSGGFRISPGLFQVNGAVTVPGGVSFTISSRGAVSCELCLFHRDADEPFAILPFPEDCRIGHTYSMIVYGLDITEIEYAYRMDGPWDPQNGLTFDRTKYLLDPYARAVTGQSVWGRRQEAGRAYHGRVVKDVFDWSGFHDSKVPFRDMIIYELHVRGFTKDESSGVANRGTFRGLMEKIPYLLELGVNAVELMPVFEFDEMADERIVDGKQLLNYWGYNTVCFFAPNTSYTAKKEYNREGTGLKELIRELNSHGIEVILDVVFNHTAEGDENMAGAAIRRILESPDLYPPDRRQDASVNFLNCHDGFTLYDLYAYNQKHNEANGWNNTDGANDNHSWNCGEEGETENQDVLRLRKRMRENALAVVFCSRGAVMFLAGDFFSPWNCLEWSGPGIYPSNRHFIRRTERKRGRRLCHALY